MKSCRMPKTLPASSIGNQVSGFHLTPTLYAGRQGHPIDAWPFEVHYFFADTADQMMVALDYSFKARLTRIGIHPLSNSIVAEQGEGSVDCIERNGMNSSAQSLMKHFGGGVIRCFRQFEVNLDPLMGNFDSSLATCGFQSVQGGRYFEFFHGALQIGIIPL